MSKRTTRTTQRKKTRKKAQVQAVKARRTKKVARKALKATGKKLFLVAEAVTQDLPFVTHGSGGGRND